MVSILKLLLLLMILSNIFVSNMKTSILLKNIEKYSIFFEKVQKTMKKAKQRYMRMWKKYKNIDK